MAANYKDQASTWNAQEFCEAKEVWVLALSELTFIIDQTALLL